MIDGMREGPFQVWICDGCVFLKTFRDWKDGDYRYCDHPVSAALGTSDKRIIHNETPTWCPLLGTF